MIYLKELEPNIYELIKDATFKQMFSDLGNNRKCWKNKEEALAFADQNKKKLGTNENFFELENGSVVGVRLGGRGRSYVDLVCKLSIVHTWNAKYERRVFSPQLDSQKLETSINFESLELRISAIERRLNEATINI